MDLYNWRDYQVAPATIGVVLFISFFSIYFTGDTDSKRQSEPIISLISSFFIFLPLSGFGKDLHSGDIHKLYLSAWYIFPMCPSRQKDV